jgi:hypothetical protein
MTILSMKAVDRKRKRKHRGGMPKTAAPAVEHVEAKGKFRSGGVIPRDAREKPGGKIVALPSNPVPKPGGKVLCDIKATGLIVTVSGAPGPGSALAAKVKELDPSVLVSVTETGKEPSGDPAVQSGIATALRQQVQSAFSTAVGAGIPAREFLEFVSSDARPYLEEPIREGYATPEQGLAAMLDEEGGCVDLATACKLFRKPGGVSRQTLSEKIRARELIAYRSGGDRWIVPQWQFRPQGGLLKGLPEVLKRMRELLPEHDELFPFTFLLQADPLLEGKTPLESLKAGETEKVIEALESHPSVAPA